MPARTKAQLIAGIESLRKQVNRLQQLVDEKKSENVHCASLFRHNPLGLLTLNQDGIILSANPAFFEMFEFSAESIVGKCKIQVLPLFKEAGISKYFNDLLKKGLEFDIESPPLKISEKKELYFRIRGRRTDVENNAFIILLGDITDRKKNELELQYNQQRYKSLYSMFRLMADNSPDLLWAKDLAGKYLFANQTMCDVLLIAKDTDEPVGKDDIYFAMREREKHPDNPQWHTFGEICADSDAIVIKNQKAQRFDEFGNIKGKFLFLDVYKAPIWDEQGKMIGTVGSARIVTEEKQAMEKLKESEQRYRTLFEHTPDGIVVHSRGKIVFVNPAAVKIGAGKNERDFIGRPIIELVHPDSIPAMMERVQKIYNKELQDIAPFEEKFIGLDGRVIDVEVMASMVDFEGQPASQVVFRDITDRKNAEREIRKLSKIVETTHQFVTMVDINKIVVYANFALVKKLGYKDKKDIIGRPMFEFSDEQGINLLQNEVIPALFSAGSWKGEIPIKRKDGSLFPSSHVCSMIKDEKGQPQYLVSIFDDITERLQAEEALRRSDSRNKALLEAIPDLMFRVTGGGKFIDFRAHDEADLYIPPDKIIGSSIKDHFPSELVNLFHQQIRKTIKTGQLHIFEYELPLPQGQQYFEARLVKSDSDEVVSIIRNITKRKHAEQERKKLEEQIQHAQKLESLGVLAGGIAHDFNNILTGVLGNAGLAQITLSPASPALDYIGKIETSSQRAAELCRQLLAYSGKGRFVVQSININSIVEEMTHLLEASISKKAIVKYQLAKNLPAVEVDTTQIRQVIMNLIINASDAIGDKSGVITITTGAMDCDSDYLKGTYLDDKLAEGLYIYLEVSDTGCGMDTRTREKIFDPFFSTKFTGRGLGLAAVLGIMRGHHGAVKVYSEPGRGTTFKVLLPTSGKPTEDLMKPLKIDKNWRGSGTIMIVDDEDTIRALGKDTLEKVGFTVLTVGNGREALTVYKKHKDEILLVLLDMTMPHLDGQETFRELRRINSEVRVILSSGYNEQDATNSFVGKGLAGFLGKPYNPSDLILKVREVMEKK